jgi:hypothetical protein
LVSQSPTPGTRNSFGTGSRLSGTGSSSMRSTSVKSPCSINARSLANMPHPSTRSRVEHSLLRRVARGEDTIFALRSVRVKIAVAGSPRPWNAGQATISAIRAGSSPPPVRFTRRDTGHMRGRSLGRWPQQLRSGCAGQPGFDVRAIQKHWYSVVNRGAAECWPKAPRSWG